MIASAARRTSQRARVTSPSSAPPAPAPGTAAATARGAAGRARAPSARTSSLNSSRSGSISLSCIRSGRPPTLWWRLDRRRRPLERDRFDHVRVERALHQELGVPPIFLRLLLEHRDELAADDLALLLGVGDARELASGSARARRPRAGRPGSVPEQRLAPAPRSPARSRPLSTKMQVSRSPIARWHQRRRHRRVDAAREPADRRARRARPARGPRATASSTKPAIVQVGSQPQIAEQEVGAGSRRRAACAPPRDGTARPQNCRAGAATAAAGQFGARRPRPRNPAAAPRRDRRGSSRPAISSPAAKPCEQLAGAAFTLHGRAAVLAVLGRADLAAEQQRGQLHAVADAEDRHAEVEDLAGDAAARPRRNSDAGPPERMMPARRHLADLRRAAALNGWISQ